MPKKKGETEQQSEGVLESAAKTIGTVVGKAVSALSGTDQRKVTDAQDTPKRRRPVKKNKARLPRKQKKSKKKAAQVVL